MSFGIGAFPFGFFGTLFNINDGRPRPPPFGGAQYQDEQMLSRVFLWVAVILMFWLFFL
nr:E3 ubiquitin-protein ligase RNF185-like [Phallusia mammillata]